MSTGDDKGTKIFRLVYLVGAGSLIVLCTAAINKWRAVKKSELQYQQHRRLLEEPSKTVD